jgi:hypothetical protein
MDCHRLNMSQNDIDRHVCLSNNIIEIDFNSCLNYYTICRFPCSFYVKQCDDVDLELLFFFCLHSVNYQGSNSMFDVV